MEQIIGKRIIVAFENKKTPHFSDAGFLISQYILIIHIRRHRHSYPSNAILHFQNNQPSVLFL
jgi:hypothetical protein